MLGLNKREGRVFRYAMVGHLLLACSLFVFGLFPSCDKDPEMVHVFELSAASAPPLPTPVVPLIEVTATPVEKLELPQTPTPLPPKSLIQKPQPKPAAQPPPLKPKSVTPKPRPKTTPASKPKTISFDQFKKQNKITQPNLVTPKPVVQAPRVSINPSNFKLPPIKLSQATPSSSSVSPTEMNRYLARIKFKLEGIWRTMLTEANLVSGGEVRLGFRISSSGSLVYPKISRSSGNPSLDRLVLEVARRAGSFGPPPGGQLSSALEIPFRVN